jgi:hypothetical protein
MRPGSQSLKSSSRCTLTLVVAALSVFLLGCFHTRPELEAYKRSYFKIRFDSNTTLVGAPRTPDDTVTRILPDVLEIMGRVLSLRSDSLLIAPSYVLISDREHPAERRTTLRRGRRALPDDMVAVIGPRDRVEQMYSGPNWPRLMAAPIAGLLTGLLLFRKNCR